MIEPMTEEQNPRENPQRNIPRNLKQYYLGLLTRGERWNKIDDKEAEELLPQHLLFLRKQMEERRYIVAGPVNEEAAYVGMMIIEAASKSEAQAIAAADPGVQAGRLAFEIFPVYLPSLANVAARY
jgi:uncharacterized protein YciI